MIVAVRRWDTASLVLLTFVLAAVAWLYMPFMGTMVTAWEQNDNYSHGYFIPFVSIAMIYSRRKELRREKVMPATSGLLLLVAGLALLVVAKIGSEYFMQRFSLILVLLGIVHFLLGGGFLKQLAFPILYLVFMIPLPAILWNKIAFPMQLFGSFLTEQVIYFLGIPVFREGNVLHLAETTLEVVAACSGLRSLMTMFALSGALVFFSSISRPKKILLFLSAAPIAIFANIVRLTATAMLASKYGSEVAQGFLHEFSGMIVFILGLILLIATNNLLSR